MDTGPSIRVLVITTWFPDHEAPSRTPFCLAHVHALQRVGYDVTVLHVDVREGTCRTPRRSAPTVEECYEGVHTLRIRTSKNSAIGWLRTWRSIRHHAKDAQVIHTMAFSSVLAVLPAWLTRRRAWIHTEHWNGVTDPRSVGRLGLIVRPLRWLLKFPNVTTGVTRELTQTLKPFSRRGRSHLVPCVVDGPDVIEPFPNRSPIRLVAVGLAIPRKDPLLAVDVLAELHRRGQDATLTWVGGGPLIEAGRQHALRAGVLEHVSFVGPVEPSQVRAHLERAHLFFLPSHQENFFTAVAESIMHGRPAVVPRSGGFVEYCTDANSVLTESWDRDALSDAVETAIERFACADPQQVADTLRGRFSYEDVGRAFARVYASAWP